MLFFDAFLICLIAIGSQCALPSLEAFVVADFNYSYVQVSLPSSNDFSLETYITDFNFPIYDIIPLKDRKSHSFNSSLLSRYAEVPNSANQPLCFHAVSFLTKEFIVVTVIEPGHSNISFKLDQIRQDESQKHSEMVYNEALSLPILPLYFYCRFKVASISEGRKYYGSFDSQHLSRDLFFYKDKKTLMDTEIVTLPRSGTHIFASTLENIYEEFTGLFDGGFERPINFDNEGGMLRPSKGFVRITINHMSKKSFMNRIVYTCRDIVEVVDSRFRLWEDPAKFKITYKKGYHREPEFKAYLRGFFDYYSLKVKVLLDGNFHKFFVDFGEMKENSEEVFCDLISFVDRFPCEYSWKPKLQSILKEKGLLSSYNASSANDKGTRQKTKELYEEYGRELVEMIHSSPLRFMAQFFGYNETAKEVFFEGFQRPEGHQPMYKESNRKTLERTLHYRDLFERPDGFSEMNKEFHKTVATRKMKKKDVEKLALNPVFEKYKVRS